MSDADLRGWIVAELDAASPRARAAAVLVPHGGDVMTLPEDAGDDALTLARGASTPWPDLVDWLRTGWPTATLWVDCPLERPDDAWVRTDPRRWVEGARVYARIDLDADPRDVDEVLRSHDPASCWAAVVVEPPASDGASVPEPSRIRAAVVAANDGEAFVCWAAR